MAGRRYALATSEVGAQLDDDLPLVTATLLERMFVQCVLRSSKRPGARTSQTEPLRRRPALRATTTSPDIQPSL